MEPKNPYDQARTYVEGFKLWNKNMGSGPPGYYEEPLSIKMSTKDWIRLSDEFIIFETDEKYPKYSYNASTSTVIIKCMPSPVHDVTVRTIARGFELATADLSRPIRTRMYIATSQNFQGFRGEFSASSKTPDLAVQFKNDTGGLEVRFILEVGFSETYEELVDDARLWLEGKPEASVVWIVKFEESPRYQCPTCNLDDEEFEQLGFPEPEEIRDQDFTLTGRYGPVTYKGLTWVAPISTAFLEVWKRDPTTGAAIQDGSRTNLFRIPANRPQLTFQLSDFLNIGPRNDRTISFDWADFRLFLRDAIMALAVERCQKMLKKRAGTGDNDF